MFLKLAPYCTASKDWEETSLAGRGVLVGGWGIAGNSQKVTARHCGAGRVGTAGGVD